MFTRFHEEDGIAMITALLVSMIAVIMSVAVVTLSIHNSSESALDRKHVQSIDAAEAGINAYYSMLTGATGAATCNTIDATLPVTPPANYHVTIQLYSVWPPVAGSELACPPPTMPAGALVRSKGTAVATGNPTAVSRTMEAGVRLVPIYGGFGQAIFSDTQLNLQNQLTLNGNIANDGDIYTNGDLTLNNNTVIAGSAYAQGGISLAQGIVKANAWGKNAVDLSSGIEVFGNATSSTSSISLSNNSHVHGNAKAGTTISGGTIDGSTAPGSPSGPPPAFALPHITYDNPCAWTCPVPSGFGYTEVDPVDCAAASAWIATMPVGDYVLRINSTCTALWGNNSTVNIKGNLAIITNGGFATQNQTNWNSVGGTWTLYVISVWRAGLNCPSGAYDINVSNNTNFNSLNMFLYSQCTINMDNANEIHGQIMGGTVNVSNQMTMDFVPAIVPAQNLTGYQVQPSYLREVKNT
jgi:hypothetical protein